MSVVATTADGGGILEQREEALHPAINGAAFDNEATLGEPLDDIGVAEPIFHIPADGYGNYVVGEGMVGERADGAGGESALASVAPPALSAQPGLPIPPRPIASAPNALHDQPLLARSEAVIVLPSRLQQDR